jgi:hypothetical protein
MHGAKNEVLYNYVTIYIYIYIYIIKYAVAQLVEALRYKPEGRGLDSRWCHWKFLLTMSTRNMYWRGVGCEGGRCVGLTTYHLHVPNALKSGSLKLLNPQGLSRPVMGLL